jgi:Ni/Fe-hydrogenase subunit HybB-like protein
MSNSTVAAKSLKGADKSLYTPFNIVSGIIIVAGLIVTILRFTGGLGSVTALNDTTAWGLWTAIAISLVPMAGAGFVAGAAYYIFGMRNCHTVVRPALLTALLGYVLVVLFAVLIMGRPWRMLYPLVYSMGTTSLLYEVALCILLYLIVLAVEFVPVSNPSSNPVTTGNKILKAITIVSIAGILLSTLHQSAQGAIFLMASHNLHPLWYSSHIGIHFLVSSIFCGLAMVIVVDMLAGRFLKNKMDETYLAERDGVLQGFAKSASFIMMGYLVLKVFSLALTDTWSHLGTGWGLWYLLEILGLVGVPCLLLAMGAREKNTALIQWGALLTVLGVIVNRFNVSLIALNWYAPFSEKYVPKWSEYVLALFILTIGIVLFRYCADRMPVFHKQAD